MDDARILRPAALDCGLNKRMLSLADEVERLDDHAFVASNPCQVLYFT
jgi:hypothetical protein